MLNAGQPLFIHSCLHTKQIMDVLAVNNNKDVADIYTAHHLIYSPKLNSESHVSKFIYSNI